MRRINLMVCMLITSILLVTGCSIIDSREEQAVSLIGRDSPMTYEEFVGKAKDRGINEIMLKTLGNLGYTDEDILSLPAETIGKIFAPGTHLDGGGFDPNESQIEELSKVGINVEMSIILYNLGYEYEEMLGLPTDEIDFIFPNTELIDNLVKKGFSKEEVQTWNVFQSEKTYKELIKEALKR